MLGRRTNPKRERPINRQGVSARRIIIALVVLVTVCVVSLIVAGVTSLISLAERIHPVAGSIVFWTLFSRPPGRPLLRDRVRKTSTGADSAEEEFGPKHDAYLGSAPVRARRQSAHARQSSDHTRRNRKCDRRFVVESTPLFAEQPARCF